MQKYKNKLSGKIAENRYILILRNEKPSNKK